MVDEVHVMQHIKHRNTSVRNQLLIIYAKFVSVSACLSFLKQESLGNFGSTLVACVGSVC